MERVVRERLRVEFEDLVKDLSTQLTMVSTRNPRLDTRNQKLETRNPKPELRTSPTRSLWYLSFAFALPTETKV